MPHSVKLTGMKPDAGPHRMRLTYSVEHRGPKVTLTLPVDVVVDEYTGKASARIEVHVEDSDSIRDALRVLGDWLSRCGTALQKANRVKSDIPSELTEKTDP